MDTTLSMYEVGSWNYRASTSATTACGIAFLYLAYNALLYFDLPVLSPRELLWNAVIYITPTRLLLNAAKRHELRANGMLSQTHAAKSEALRSMLGIGGSAFLRNLPGEAVVRKTGMFTTFKSAVSDTPPGLGNWDNSCYQNSVLQGLASLATLRNFLERTATSQHESTCGTSASLLETVVKLCDPANNGQQLWTPSKLKSMSSWQQQDAQEYFSKIMDELDKETAKSAAGTRKQGLGDAMTDLGPQEAATSVVMGSKDTREPGQNPMEGLLAQRVSCTQCGYSEGLSMIPFNCLTVPLGPSDTYSIEDCLGEYVKLEEISEVECGKCTLLRTELQLKQLASAPQELSKPEEPSRADLFSLPPDIRAQIASRLQAVREAIEDEDFSDRALSETCRIPKKSRVSSTKTRQAVIGRAPQSLVVHVNRSLFDEITGTQRKNYAAVRYPLLLDLAPWMLEDGVPGDAERSPLRDRPTQSMLSDTTRSARYAYLLQAVVTHYGRHENGHYICYRRHPAQGSASDISSSETADAASKWWRLSDEDVTAVSEGDVLDQGGVFMLFYERIDSPHERPVVKDAVAAFPQSEAMKEPAIAAEAAAPLSSQSTLQDEDNIAVEKAAVQPSGTLVSTPAVEEVQTLAHTLSSETSDIKDAIKSNSPAEQQTTSPAPTLVSNSLTQPLRMRTAHGGRFSGRGTRQQSAFEGSMRPMATT